MGVYNVLPPIRKHRLYAIVEMLYNGWLVVRQLQKLRFRRIFSSPQGLVSLWETKSLRDRAIQMFELRADVSLSA